jgi:hypothetical protein
MKTRNNYGGSPEVDIWREQIRKLYKKELLTVEEENLILTITRRLP